MLLLTFLFLVLAFIAGLCGFGVIAIAAVGFAKIVFWLLLFCLFVTLVVGLTGLGPW